MCYVANDMIAGAVEKVGDNYIIWQPDINRLIFPAFLGVYVQRCQQKNCRRNGEGREKLHYSATGY